MKLQTNTFLPFALPEIGEEEIAEVVDSMRSGWLTTGPKTRRFEKDFSEFIGGDVEAVAVNSATAGLHLALEAIGVAPGDEVITTPYTFTATAEVIRYLGADPVFVDIDPATFNIDHTKIEAKITPLTKAIIPVHYGGFPCDMNAIHDIARRHNLKVVEDAAHALPATYQGKLIGSMDSEAVVFSFYATKTLATGEGGMIVSKNPDLAKRVRTMRLHGIDRDIFNRYTADTPSWYYEVVAPGFKYNMTDLAAAIGIHQLTKVYRFRAKREKIADAYNENFSDLPIILPPTVPEGELHAWHLYAIRLTDDAPVSRNHFIEEMSKNKIGTSVHFIPLHIQPYWCERYNLKPEDLPCATECFSRETSLPIYSKMTNSDIENVIKAVRKILA